MEKDISQAAQILRQGGIVALPTETVYGLGASIWSESALARIFATKGRPADNPLIVHVAEKEQVSEVANAIPKIAHKLMDAFWPGPLTLVLPRAADLSSLVTAGLETVAVRQPDHPVALELIRQTGSPIAAPSANRSGQPSPTTAEHVRQDLGTTVDMVLDGGATRFGLESTVVDVSTPQPTLLRAGAVSVEELEEVLCQPLIIATHVRTNEAARSPGQKYAHYQPHAEVVLLPQTLHGHEVALKVWIEEQHNAGERIGLIAPSKEWQSLAVDSLFSVDGDITELAHSLFAFFREADKQDLTLLLVPQVPITGIGRAVMDRLTRAATSIWQPQHTEELHARN